MSTAIKLIPTASGIASATSAISGGFKLKGKFIGFGKGNQSIVINDNNQAETNTLKSPIAWLEILSATEQMPGQWLLAVDIKGANNGVEFDLTEVALSTAETIETAADHIVSIYGHATQKIATVSPGINHFEIGVYFNLGAFPADSIEIVHQDLPSDLFSIDQIAALYVYQLGLDDALFTQREKLKQLEQQTSRELNE